MGEKPFRVIIVGAGPVGLYLAAALARADIDFVVLERYHTILTHAGAGTVLWSYGTRLLAQLGVLENIDNAARVTDRVEVLRSGREQRRANYLGAMEERFGYPCIALSRAELIRVLYESIPNVTERTRCNAHVVDIETDEDGVRVRLKDGTVVEGSVVVGVDGVHSTTRNIMQRLSGTPPTQMTTTFRGIFGKAYGVPQYVNGLFYEMRGTRMAIQSFGAGDKVHFAMIFADREPTTERRTYDEKEMMQFADRYGDLCIAPGVTFRDFWAHADRDNCRLINQEEGFVEGPWHHGRIVLLGDAVHKMTTITGQGVNAGMHSAASLANELRRAVLDSSGGAGGPDAGRLEEAFERYERTRKDATRVMCQVSSKVTRLVTWSSWFNWFMDRFIVGLLGKKPALARLSKLMANGLVLDYVPFTDPKPDAPWRNYPQAKL